MPINCLIVDDEPLAIEILQAYVDRIDSIHLVDTCTNALKAFEIVKKQPIDLIFLDIQMPGLTGIEFLKALKPAPQVIFTTAYRDYAVESYELSVVDYLVKPIAFDRFMMAVNKVVEDLPVPVSVSETSSDDSPYLFLKSDRKMVKVYLKDITYIEGLKDYVRVKTTDGKEIVSLQKISYLEEKLPSDCFLRIHKSYLVSKKRIDAFSASQVEIGEVSIPIGRSYKQEIMQVLGADKSVL